MAKKAELLEQAHKLKLEVSNNNTIAEIEEAIKNADSANNLRLRVKLTEEGGFEKKTAPLGGAKSEEAEKSPDDLQLQVDNN